MSICAYLFAAQYVGKTLQNVKVTLQIVEKLTRLTNRKPRFLPFPRIVEGKIIL